MRGSLGCRRFGCLPYEAFLVEDDRGRPAVAFLHDYLVKACGSIVVGFLDEAARIFFVQRVADGLWQIARRDADKALLCGDRKNGR